jgi:hypothetical protein
MTRGARVTPVESPTVTRLVRGNLFSIEFDLEIKVGGKLGAGLALYFPAF